MKVLIVGSGGREHAIALAVSRSQKVDKIYCAPGNAGIAELAECVEIKAMEFDKLVAFAKEKEIDLTIIGMDDPLVGGVVDEFEKAGLRCFGPRKNAAILEGSKAFSKDLMKKYNIPTAGYENFTDPEAALKYLETAKYPIVLKADGLALGKGVIIAKDHDEAKAAVKEIMEDKKFGDSGNNVVVEEFLTGPEVSVLAFTDGIALKPMVSSKDHKRAYDNDEGLNTGGMGTVSPNPYYTDEIAEIFTMMNPDDRMFYAKFNSPTFINQRLIGLKRKHSADNLDLLHALLNSVLSLFYIEAVGFGRGLGVLDINKTAISNCYMLNPALLTQKQITNIMEKFSFLVARGIKDINQDLTDPIRQEFDRAVLNAYGIGGYLNNIVDSLKSMREIRKAAKEISGTLIPFAEAARNMSRSERFPSIAAENELEQ